MGKIDINDSIQLEQELKRGRISLPSVAWRLLELAIAIDRARRESIHSFGLADALRLSSLQD